MSLDHAPIINGVMLTPGVILVRGRAPDWLQVAYVGANGTTDVKGTLRGQFATYRVSQLTDEEFSFGGHLAHRDRQNLEAEYLLVVRDWEAQGISWPLGSGHKLRRTGKPLPAVYDHLVPYDTYLVISRWDHLPIVIGPISLDNVLCVELITQTTPPLSLWVPTSWLTDQYFIYYPS